MFEYIQDKSLRTELREIAEEIILDVQKEVKEFFTFSFKLIGSGESKLMMINGNDNTIDLDYNLVIQRDKKNMISNPRKIKLIFMDAFRKVSNQLRLNDKTNVIKCKYGTIGNYYFSVDIAILIECNDGYQYKLINDKNTNNYIWNKVPYSKDFEEKYAIVKKEGGFEEVKRRYKEKKNKSLKKKDEKHSFSLLAEAVNEVFQIIKNNEY